MFSTRKALLFFCPWCKRIHSGTTTFGVIRVHSIVEKIIHSIKLVQRPTAPNRKKRRRKRTKERKKKENGKRKTTTTLLTCLHFPFLKQTLMRIRNFNFYYLHYLSRGKEVVCTPVFPQQLFRV